MPTAREAKDAIKDQAPDAYPEEPNQPEPEGFDPLDLDASGWKPTTGEKLWGRVVKVEEASSDFGPYPLIQVFVTEGPRAGELVNVHCFHSVLRSFTEQSHPAYGDRLGVKYKGKKLANAEGEPVGFNGNGYEDYNVVLVPMGRLPKADQESFRVALPAGAE